MSVPAIRKARRALGVANIDTIPLARRGLALAPAVVFVVACIAASPASAEYAAVELEIVQLDRLTTNLEKQLESKPDDPDLLHRLARIRAMAYASKDFRARIQKGHEEWGPWFGYDPPSIPFEVVEARSPEKRRAAAAELDEAIRLYERVVELAPDHMVAALGLAWCLDQRSGGEGDDRRRAVEGYRSVVERAWKKEKDAESSFGAYSFLTVEASRYLVPHLDPENDREELRDLQQKGLVLDLKPRLVTPIAIPLDPDLGPERMVDRDVVVDFDLDGSALPQRWHWLAPGAAWLAWDPRGDGRIGSGLQLFGSVSFWIFWRDGYDALAALDDDGDGWLRGAELRHLVLWSDLDQDGRSEPGEVRPLARWGIEGLATASEPHPTGIRYSPRGVELADGSRRPSYDLVLESLRPEAVGSASPPPSR